MHDRLSFIRSSLQAARNESGRKGIFVPDNYVIRTVVHCEGSMNGTNPMTSDPPDTSICIAIIRDSDYERATEQESLSDGEE